jgi:hypothetical protein
MKMCLSYGGGSEILAVADFEPTGKPSCNGERQAESNKVPGMHKPPFISLLILIPKKTIPAVCDCHDL